MLDFSTENPASHKNKPVSAQGNEAFKALQEAFGETNWRGEQSYINESENHLLNPTSRSSLNAIETQAVATVSMIPNAVDKGVAGLTKIAQWLEKSKETRLTRREFNTTAAAVAGTFTSIHEAKKIIDKMAEEKQMLTAEKINGIDVYGLNEQINDEATIQQLYKQAEQMWDNGGREKADPNARYLEFFVDRDVYNKFEEGGKGTFAIWVNRHLEKLNDIMAKAIPPTRIRTEMKRIVVLGPNFRERVNNWQWCQKPLKQYPFNPYEHSIQDLAKGDMLVPDVDGRWYLDKELRGQVAYYDDNEHYDVGLMHELGHSLLSLIDLYPLDWEGVMNPLIPEGYKRYRGGDYLMAGGVGEAMDMWSNMALEYMRKNGIVRRDRKLLGYEAGGGWYPNVRSYYPIKTEVITKNAEGKPMAGCKYKLVAIPKTKYYGDYLNDKIQVIDQGVLNAKGAMELNDDNQIFWFRTPDSSYGTVNDTTSTIFTHILIVEGTDGKTYTQPLTPLPFGVKYLAGDKNTSTLTVNFRDYVLHKDDIKIINDKGSPVFSSSDKIFYFEDKNGQPVKDEQGQPISCHFGEFGTGVYRIGLDTKKYKINGIKGIAGKDVADLAVPTTIRIFNRGGTSKWSFESENDAQDKNDNGQLQSTILLPYGQVMTHRYKPDLIVVQTNKTEGDNYNKKSYEELVISISERT